jgi:hypothetical protein
MIGALILQAAAPTRAATLRNNLVIDNMVHVSAEGYGHSEAGVDDCDSSMVFK